MDREQNVAGRSRCSTAPDPVEPGIAVTDGPDATAFGRRSPSTPLQSVTSEDALKDSHTRATISWSWLRWVVHGASARVRSSESCATSNKDSS
jgi:hypothetical protein